MSSTGMSDAQLAHARVLRRRLLAVTIPLALLLLAVAVKLLVMGANNEAGRREWAQDNHAGAVQAFTATTS